MNRCVSATTRRVLLVTLAWLAGGCAREQGDAGTDAAATAVVNVRVASVREMAIPSVVSAQGQWRAAVEVAINAPFLQEIKEDHQELRQLLERLELAFAPHSHLVSRREVTEWLHGLQDRLALHFALEEAYGYCEDALSVAPWLSARAAQLRGEHADLFAEVAELVELAEGGLYHEAGAEHFLRIAAPFRRFLASFQRHERAECALIQGAYSQDFGCGD